MSKPCESKVSACLSAPQLEKNVQSWQTLVIRVSPVLCMRLLIVPRAPVLASVM